MKKANIHFEKGRILPLLIKYSLPSTFASVITLIYNATDRYFIGREVGKLGMGALSIMFPLLMLAGGTAQLFSVGGASLAGIKMGEGKLEESKKVVGTCFFWIVLIGILYTVLGFVFMDEIIGGLGGRGEIFAYSKEYAIWFFPSIGFNMIYLCFCAFIRSEGKPLSAMIVSLAFALVNMVLDYYFVVVKGMGLKGAALATTVATIVPTIMLMVYFFRSKVLRLELKYIRPNLGKLKTIAIIGNSGFLNQFLNGLVVFSMNLQLKSYGGDVALAGIGVITLVRNFLNTSFIGFNQGRQPIASFNYGAKNFKRVRSLYLTSTVLTMSVAVTLVIFTMLNAEMIASFFIKDVEVINFIKWGIKINLVMMFMTAYYLSTANYFQSVGKGMVTTRFIFLRLIVLTLPLIWILPNFFGLKGALLAFPISDSITALVAGYFAKKEMKNLTLMEESKKY